MHALTPVASAFCDSQVWAWLAFRWIICAYYGMHVSFIVRALSMAGFFGPGVIICNVLMFMIHVMAGEPAGPTLGYLSSLVGMLLGFLYTLLPCAAPMLARVAGVKAPAADI